MPVIFTLLTAVLLQAPADAALQPWTSKALPGDIAKRHVEEISQAKHTYDFDRDKGLGTLKWKANSVGRRPAKYRVYGSDEKGFSISDVPYTVNVGISKELKPHFPANFIAETAAIELPVLGSEVTPPAANKTYYRLVAVDAEGKRSGPSDYAVAPRPVIYSKPAIEAKVGAEYRSQVSANRGSVQRPPAVRDRDGRRLRKSGVREFGEPSNVQHQRHFPRSLVLPSLAESAYSSTLYR